MAISHGRSRFPVGRLVLRLLTRARALSSSSSFSTNSSRTPLLSLSSAKSRLRKEYDPDKALSIISSAPNPSSSRTSGRFAVEFAARRLFRARRFTELESFLESHKSDSAASQEPFLSNVILCYGSAFMLDRAIATFKDIPRLCSAPPTILSFNALLCAAIRARRYDQIPNIFTEFSEKHDISPDKVSFGILVKALCLSRKSSKAIEILKEMREKDVEVTTVTYTTIIDSLYKEGKPEKAEKLWNEMLVNGCAPDLASYNVKIMHRALKGRSSEVLESISELQAAGLKPDTITYNYLMTCYSNEGRSDDAKKVYMELKSNGCPPNSTTYKVMLNHLCKNEDFDAGFDVFKKSMKSNKIPGFRTMKPLVVGLAKNSKLEEAKMVIAEVRKRFPANMVGAWKVVEEELGLV
ncbi:hypothetical protein HPP92_014698 [Vanilla planifolia]|uniref:Pentatricopeptide repeat-containing protein n=1 Tax=Vanilla planifolia TaxID=51239 RepID=A0A835UV04_VANPL|nr:hypothetical protein HPP92_014698 [Vanilla planifolia]